MEAYRQGDVLIIPISETEIEAWRFTQERGQSIRRERGQGLVLAEGEATGHAHRVMNSRARLRRHSLVFGGRRIAHTCLSVPPEGAVVEHEEHAPIPLAHGKYLVVRQSEYTPTSETREREVTESIMSSSRAWVAD